MHDDRLWGPFRHVAAQCSFGRKQGEADTEMMDQGDRRGPPDPKLTKGGSDFTYLELPGGATVTPRVPPRSMNFSTAPEALASSTNSLT